MEIFLFAIKLKSWQGNQTTSKVGIHANYSNWSIKIWVSVCLGVSMLVVMFVDFGLILRIRLGHLNLCYECWCWYFFIYTLNWLLLYCLGFMCISLEIHLLLFSPTWYIYTSCSLLTSIHSWCCYCCYRVVFPLKYTHCDIYSIFTSTFKWQGK